MQIDPTGVVYMCVFVCMCKYVSIHACVQRSEADTGDQRSEVDTEGQRGWHRRSEVNTSSFPQSCFTLGFETDSLTESGVPQFD